jgi:hypothetical protein
MKLGDNVSRLVRELGVDRTCPYIWKRKLEQRPYRKKPIRKWTGAITESKSWRPKVHAWKESQSVVGAGFFRECLAQDRGESAHEEREWRESLHAEIRSRMRAQGRLSIQRMCQLLGISRASFYRHWEKVEPARQRWSCAAPCNGWPWRTFNVFVMVVQSSETAKPRKHSQRRKNCRLRLHKIIVFTIFVI